MDKLKLIIISDGTGETASSMARAVMKQFEDKDVYFISLLNIYIPQYINGKLYYDKPKKIQFNIKDATSESMLKDNLGTNYNLYLENIDKFKENSSIDESYYKTMIEETKLYTLNDKILTQKEFTKNGNISKFIDWFADNKEMFYHRFNINYYDTICVIGHSKIMRKFIYNINKIRHDYLSNQNIWSFLYKDIRIYELKD